MTSLPIRLTTGVQAAGRRVRPHLWPAVQASVAVAVAWYLAHTVLGHPAPIFAPVAAAVTLGASRVMRGQRAVQLIGGVTIGIGIGVAIRSVAGAGALAIGLATLVAMCVAITIGGGFAGNGVMFINQASVSAILMIALQLPGGVVQRLIEALVGGGVAVVIAVLLFPAAPLPLLREAVQAVFGTLHAALEHLDEIVADPSTADRTWALGVGERIYEQLGQLIAGRFTATEIVRLAPRWWHLRSTVRAADVRLGHVNLLASGVMSLLRTTVDGLGVEPALPAQLRMAVQQLSEALGALAGDGEAGPSAAVARAARAGRLTAEGGHEPGTHALLIASIIDTCVGDLYRAVGAEPEQPDTGPS
jgi:uncharacterized membrane protein YgaE (UPF0421/DUF939 family)